MIFCVTALSLHPYVLIWTYWAVCHNEFECTSPTWCNQAENQNIECDCNNVMCFYFLQCYFIPILNAILYLCTYVRLVIIFVLCFAFLWAVSLLLVWLVEWCCGSLWIYTCTLNFMFLRILWSYTSQNPTFYLLKIISELICDLCLFCL